MNDDDLYQSTTRWLQEAAQRSTANRRKVSSAELSPAVTGVPAKRRRERTILGVGREIYMFAVLIAVYLNYYFMEVVTEIDSLPSLIVFVSSGAPRG